MQKFNNFINRVFDILRKDRGFNDKLDMLMALSWILFLKIIDDIDYQREQEAILMDEEFSPLIEAPYRWCNWATKEEFAGYELISFIKNDDILLPDGNRGRGLFAYLRNLQIANSPNSHQVTISKIFQGIVNYPTNGYILRDVLNQVNDIHFTSKEDTNEVSELYESILEEIHHSTFDFGCFYTPQAIVRAIVAATSPKLGETVLDPACGTAGFLIESYKHLKEQCKTTQDWEILRSSNLAGEDKEPSACLLAQLNFMLHTSEYPNINLVNSLHRLLPDISDEQKVDIIITNPPFGAVVDEGIQTNFTWQTRDSNLLFIQLIMHLLKGKPSSRAAIIVPNGFLFGDGITSKIKKHLLDNFNLHTILRLPIGIFSPYTVIPTNILFFDRSKSTDEIWYYELPLPEGRKTYSKRNPLRYEDFSNFLTWYYQRTENKYAWKVLVKDVIKQDKYKNLIIDLDIKRPQKSEEKFEYLNPQDIINNIINNESEVINLMLEIKQIMLEVDT